MKPLTYVLTCVKVMGRRVVLEEYLAEDTLEYSSQPIFHSLPDFLLPHHRQSQSQRMQRKGHELVVQTALGVSTC